MNRNEFVAKLSLDSSLFLEELDSLIETAVKNTDLTFDILASLLSERASKMQRLQLVQNRAEFLEIVFREDNE